MTEQCSEATGHGQRRYLALWFPFLPTDRLMREASSRCAVPDDAPFALVEKVRGAMRLAALDPRAHALGLTPGLALADARARIPALAVFDADPQADLRWLERIADRGDRFTPMVALDPPDGLTFDITGCTHLFGGERQLVRDVEQHMRPWVSHMRHACADTALGAQALARFQTVPAPSEAEALRRLPIAALRLESETEIALRRAGLKTIGDLAARPVAPLAARFGAEAVDTLAAILGRTDRRITPRRPPPALLFERRFADPVTQTEHALGIIGELARQAAAALEERRKGGRHFTARLFRTDGRVYDIAIECGLPVRDADLLIRLFRERMSALADPVDPGFGFDMIRLSVPHTEPLGATQLELEGGAIHEEAMAALIDRLSTRLGRGRIRRLVWQDTHIPEQGVLALPAIDVPAPEPWIAPEPGQPPLRPIHLFDPPQPIHVMAEVPDGPPRRFRWRRAQHDIIRFEGPERIAAQWWRQPGKQGLTRDYYRVEDARGRRFWLFRHGLYDREKPDPRWYIHGLFA